MKSNITPEKLYDAIDAEVKANGFKPNNNWGDKITYASKLLMCEQMVQSGEWKKLPESVLERTMEFELVL